MLAKLHEVEEHHEYDVATETVRAWIDLCEEEPQTTEQPDLPAPNTVMWWLCRIADPEIRRKAVGNCLKADNTAQRQNIKCHDASDAILSGWHWDPLDGRYWFKITQSEIPLLPEPDFTEYNELRK